MTTTELEAIADQIHYDFQKLRSDRIAWHVKLLRSIEISALREALEVMQKHLGMGADYINLSAIDTLTAKIRNLELK